MGRRFRKVAGTDFGAVPPVPVLDRTTTTLPDRMRDQFAGCGGSYGSGQAAKKLQTEWD